MILPDFPPEIGVVSQTLPALLGLAAARNHDELPPTHTLKKKQKTLPPQGATVPDGQWSTAKECGNISCQHLLS